MGLPSRRWNRKNSASGPGLHPEAAFGGHGDDPLQRRPRTAGKRRPVRIRDVADDAADARAAGAPLDSPRALGPWKDLKGREVGLEIHVRLFDADEALDGRSVEHDLSIEGVDELAVGDLDVLDRPEDVGELEADELHPLFFRPREDAPSSRSATAGILITSTGGATYAAGSVAGQSAPTRPTAMARKRKRLTHQARQGITDRAPLRRG